MKLKANLLFIIVFVCSFYAANQLCAETVITSNSYKTDFEDSEEREKWELNRGPLGGDCANKWYIGQPGANEGMNGLDCECFKLFIFIKWTFPLFILI